MKDSGFYQISLRGEVDIEEVNSMAPIRMVLEGMDPTSIQCSVHTDQSGVIGLLRTLNGLGLTLLCVQRQDERIDAEKFRGNI